MDNLIDTTMNGFYTTLRKTYHYVLRKLSLDELEAIFIILEELDESDGFTYLVYYDVFALSYYIYQCDKDIYKHNDYGKKHEFIKTNLEDLLNSNMVTVFFNCLKNDYNSRKPNWTKDLNWLKEQYLRKEIEFINNTLDHSSINNKYEYFNAKIVFYISGIRASEDGAFEQAIAYEIFMRKTAIDINLAALLNQKKEEYQMMRAYLENNEAINSIEAMYPISKLHLVNLPHMG